MSLGVLVAKAQMDLGLGSDLRGQVSVNIPALVAASTNPMQSIDPDKMKASF